MIQKLIITRHKTQPMRFIEKYAESSQYISNLRAFREVTIIFGVNAIRPLTIEINDISKKYRSILFNFPHTGTESVKVHESLLAHIISEASKVLGASTLSIEENLFCFFKFPPYIYLQMRVTMTAVFV